MHGLEWSAMAKRDMRGLYEYIYDKNRSGADRVLAKIEAAAKLLKTVPNMGIIFHDGVLKHPVPTTEYTIYYKMDEKKVVVLRVRHQAQSIPDYSNDDDGWLS